jgi:hypothetical protein
MKKWNEIRFIASDEETGTLTSFDTRNLQSYSNYT